MLPFITSVRHSIFRSIRCRLLCRPTTSRTSRYLKLNTVWNELRSGDHFREDRGGEQAEEGTRARNHQELHHLLRPDLDLQENTVPLLLPSHEINQFCSSHTLQEVVIDKFDTLDESLENALQEGCKVWAPGIESTSTFIQSSPLE